MARNAFDKAADALRERLTSVWVLLSQTTDFASRTRLFPQYEDEFRAMRQTLQSRSRDPAAAAGIRTRLVEIRHAFRLSGYDLSVGRCDLSIQGFRNDDAESLGFRRIVVFIGERGLWFEAGQANHNDLFTILERRLSLGPPVVIIAKHYLWYRWDRDLLLLSGSATETRRDLEMLTAWCEDQENRNRILSRMNSLR
ncbi:MAG: hypothetical protein NT080_14840 [Spirochaetes bacterium]|nr:hypothetical protein [Spirochaetota bacterium]